ncbi:cytochrome c biogenesis CcdA family protein [Paenibacillus cellulositrophicus]|uniref:Cytochrome C biogenesis protein n=3 Tax=Paenibacillus TaxID=44249 RepID=A0A1R1EUR5_9BACL|nr:MULTISPECIES: cytochrome c biogenesis protein CcdA [Paenibacillus]MBJ9988373.1 sulfite exporter TauE/SafE family protein [Paenibacillus sp. S28]MCM2999461.1 cytochrome c biogenesis protein CcdA [Paenibacillus cellulositrophicus]OMF55603.1 cytochrome C biogenesis protein [Paenibacillus rhizosphaerae]OXL84759.1 cytochrome C biogenesis protein [Paenibacillus sp. SSG-1]PQP87792.1 cytochrome C biogenesis protein [Paenibacillus sp. AR247]
MSNLNIWLAFFAGLASFISPCCLPLYPSYISYITGMSVQTLKTEQNKKEVRYRTMSHTLAFILGFSAVFYTLGVGAGLFGSFFNNNRDLIRQLSALLIILMGLFLIGIFQPRFLMREFKMDLKFKPAGYIGSFIFGIGFSAGWSPCVGPILAAIIALATTEPGAWFPLITAYTVGFAIPFFVLAFFIGSTKWIVKYSGMMMKIGGALMLFMGVLLFTNQMTKITIWLQAITPEWLKF